MRFLLLLIGVFSFSTHAFINIETLRVSPVDGYTGSVDLTGQSQSGNTEKNILNFSSLNRLHEGRNEFLAVANYAYGETSMVKDTHRGSAHLRYARQVLEQWFGEIFVQTEFDEFKDLARRDLLGVAARAQLIHSKSFFLFSGTGFFAERELIKHDPDQDNLRGNFYLSSVYRGELPFKVSLIAYFQPLWDELNDYRLNMDLDFESPIYKTLSFLISYDYQFDNRPPSGTPDRPVKKYDSLVLVGLRWNI